MASKSKVYFFFPGPRITLDRRSELKERLEKIFKKEGVPLEKLTYIFCTDAYLLKINQQYLQHDEYTDIITFDLSEPKGETIGEIYISTDRVKDNAHSLGLTFKAELRRVIIHGALHLCGYKDKSRSQVKKMREKEDYYLKH